MNHTVTPMSGLGGATSAAPALPLRPRRGRLHAALVTIRPRQWIKNLLVIAAAGAAGALGHDDVPVRVGLAFVAFCLLASGIYAVNDVRDAEEDRLHPRKQTRPVAAGELAPAAALRMGVALMIAGLVLCAVVRPLLLLVGASYSVLWRRVVILDIVAIAGGFVLRAVAGGVAAPVTLSRWFIVVITCAALLVAAGKRYAELTRTTADAAAKRRVLHLYTPRRLRMILAASGAGALFAYGVWAFELPAVDGVPWRPLTVIPFAAALVRYGQLVLSGDGEAPEELVLRDRWLALAAVSWLIVFAIGVQAAT
jgi:decaprenyl-phosphate phosphoribosyltransferase